MSFTRAKTSRDKIYKDKKNLRFDSANVANQSVSPREENFKCYRINQTEWFDETPIRVSQ
jgi:hypothetical protein